MEAVAEEYISRIRQLTSSHQFRLRPRSFEPTNRGVASINGRAVVGVQWRLGSGLNPISPNAATQDEVWFYQGMALSRLNQVLENELPELPSFHYNPNNDSATEDDFFDSAEAGVIHSFLPDGSYFGMGAGQLPGLLPISRYELSEPPFLGHLG